LAIGWLAARLTKAHIGAAGIVILGLMLAFIGIAPGYVYIMAAAFILGLALTPVEATFVTLVQEITPDSSRGRVFSAFGTFGSMAGMVSMAGAGGAAELIGIPAVYVACGAIVILAGLLFGGLVKEPARPTPAPPVETRLAI
jgi:MFS family permease